MIHKSGLYSVSEMSDKIVQMKYRLCAPSPAHISWVQSAPGSALWRQTP